MKKNLADVPRIVPKIGYRKILYTTDLSASGRHAFQHAASLSKAYGSELTVFHVVEGGTELDRRFMGYVDEHLWEQIRTQNLQEAMSILLHRKRDNVAVYKCVGDFCDEIHSEMPDHAEITYNIEVKLGDPAEQIIKTAVEEGFDLIIMGAHKHGAIKAWVMGSTLKTVLRKSGIPVLMVQVP